MFDLLGFVAPIILQGKILLQRSWKGGIWDTSCSMLSVACQKWQESVEDKPVIRIPRWIGCCSDEGQELHLFSDASEKAVGCCIYVTSRSSQKLVFAKSRVAPLKVQTLARLELQAAYLGCRSLKFVCEEMRIEPKAIFA